MSKSNQRKYRTNTTTGKQPMRGKKEHVLGGKRHQPLSSTLHTIDIQSMTPPDCAIACIIVSEGLCCGCARPVRGQYVQHGSQIRATQGRRTGAQDEALKTLGRPTRLTTQSAYRADKAGWPFDWGRPNVRPYRGASLLPAHSSLHCSPASRLPLHQPQVIDLVCRPCIFSVRSCSRQLPCCQLWPSILFQPWRTNPSRLAFVLYCLLATLFGPSVSQHSVVLFPHFLGGCTLFCASYSVDSWALCQFMFNSSLFLVFSSVFSFCYML